MFLKKGNRGENVKYLQYGLNIMCCGTNGIDGIYGQGTVDAVKKFQRRFNLGSDGIVGNGTWNKLCSEIRKVQQALKNKGYLSSVDGVAGSGTFNAVKKFQRDHNLSADGMVGQGTWNALNGSSGGGSSSDGLLRVGSRGEDVETLQMTLKLRGYSIGQSGADGIFGAGTEKAVKEFQRDHNLSADGIVGPATQEALHHDYSGYTDYGELLRIGSSGPAVAGIQDKLSKLGYSVGASGVDGIFGSGTYNAVRKFQSDHGLASDGIVGPSTKKALNSSDSNTDAPLLRSGSNGSKVKELQRLLINIGYNVGNSGADGIFGQGTYNAVVKFQQSRGLSADGIVGPATWSQLKNGKNNMGLLKIGSRGESVKELQESLIKNGYSVGNSGADGIFGQGTYNAVIKFQQSRGLSADGIVGINTWNSIYSNDIDKINIAGGPSVEKFVKIAESQEFHERMISSKEGDNMTPYGAWFGMNGQPWCAMFVSWCANKAGIMNNIVPRYSFCADAVNWYRSKGRYKTKQSGYKPKRGDIIFYYNANANAPFCHTGIVTGYDSVRDEVITTEGNASQAVRHNLRYPRSYWKIHGYGCNGGTKREVQKNELDKINNLGLCKLFKIEFEKSSKDIILFDSKYIKIKAHQAIKSSFGDDSAAGFKMVNGKLEAAQVPGIDGFNSELSKQGASIGSALKIFAGQEVGINCGLENGKPKISFSQGIKFNDKDNTVGEVVVDVLFKSTVDEVKDKLGDVVDNVKETIENILSSPIVKVVIGIIVAAIVLALVYFFGGLGIIVEGIITFFVWITNMITGLAPAV